MRRLLWRSARMAHGWPPPSCTRQPSFEAREPGAAVTEPAEVLIAEQISADEAVEIVADFRSIGLAADLWGCLAETLPWRHYMARPRRRPAAAFLQPASPKRR